MDFNKIAKDMMDLQTKLVVYEKRSCETKELLTKLLKENLKLEKKLEKETDEIDKLFIQIKIQFNKRMIHQIESIYKNSIDTLDEKDEVKSEK